MTAAVSNDGNRYGYGNRYRYSDGYANAVNACGNQAQRSGRGQVRSSTSIVAATIPSASAAS